MPMRIGLSFSFDVISFLFSSVAFPVEMFSSICDPQAFGKESPFWAMRQQPRGNGPSNFDLRIYWARMG